jgi:hypothetical protein
MHAHGAYQHEQTKLPPPMNAMNGVLFYWCLINDPHMIVILCNPEQNFEAFADTIKEYGPLDKCLNWEVFAPSHCIGFLDLTV